MKTFEVTEDILKKLEEQLFKYELKLLASMVGNYYSDSSLKSKLKELNFEDKIINLILEQSETLGSMIKRKRIASNLAPAKLAQILKITEKELLEIENNEEKKPHIRLLLKITRVLRLPENEKREMIFRAGYNEKNIHEAEKKQDVRKITPREKTDTTAKDFGELINATRELGGKIKREREKLTSPPESQSPPAEQPVPAFSGQIKIIPILEGEEIISFPRIAPRAGTNKALTITESYKIPVDFIIKVKNNDMIETGITKGMLCFIKKQQECCSGDFVLLAVYRKEKASNVIRRVSVIGNNITVYQDGRGNILGIPENGKIETIGKVIFKQDDPRNFM